jgi:ParB family chromosome partitioning protein
MARVKEVREIPLSNLEIGKAQVRLRDVGKEIDELAASIAKVGLLEPIVVVESAEPDTFEIITGQRRFLAHQLLKKDSILAAVLDEPVSETTAKVLSVTENLVRRDLNSRDLIDVCTELYRKYGSIKDVAAETGLPATKVAQYVKYEALVPELKQAVDSGDVPLDAALRAQKAADARGDVAAEQIVELAKEMAPMSGAQRRRVVEQIQDSPDQEIDDAIEHAKSGGKVVQLLVTLTSRVHSSLQQVAKDEGLNMDSAAGELIEEALMTRGMLD